MKLVWPGGTGRALFTWFPVINTYIRSVADKHDCVYDLPSCAVPVLVPRWSEVFVDSELHLMLSAPNPCLDQLCL